MDFSHLCDQLYNILNIIIYKIFKNISRSPSFSRSTESNINVVFNIIIELDKTSNAREHQDEISSSEMKRSTKMSKVCSGHAFHAAQYNFGLGGNWAGITQNVIRYSVVNRRLIVVCSCVLYIYIYTRYVVLEMVILSYCVSIVFRSWVIRVGNSCRV